MIQMKLGWWRAENGYEFKIDIELPSGSFRWRSSKVVNMAWADDGSLDSHTSNFQLIEFIRPLEDLPLALNSAVKAAEDMVRRLEQHHAALQNQANEACEILVQARRELERLERECEVGK